MIHDVLFLLRPQNSKKLIKECLKVLCTLIISSLLGFLLLALVQLIPYNEKMDAHMYASAKTIHDEGTYPHVFRFCHSQLDNFTDARELLKSAVDTDQSIWNCAAKGSYGYYSGNEEIKDPCEALYHHYYLREPFNMEASYGRYWHGYKLFLRPLLLLTDYQGIRTINGVLQCLLLLVVLILMDKKGLKSFIIPYLISVLMINPYVIALSLQYSSCYYLLNLGIIAVLLLPEKWEKAYVFLIIGILTSYFDFLTYPVATFGIPMMIVLLIQRKSQPERNMASLIKCGFFWCIGYGVMWSSKWMLGSWVSGTNIFAEASNAFKIRVSDNAPDGVTNIALIDTFWGNIKLFLYTPIVILAGIYVAYLLIKIIKKSKNKTNKKMIPILLPYAFLAVLPFIWYTFAQNHSSIHSWFTNKACIVTAFAVMSSLILLQENGTEKIAK